MAIFFGSVFQVCNQACIYLSCASGPCVTGRYHPIRIMFESQYGTQTPFGTALPDGSNGMTLPDGSNRDLLFESKQACTALTIGAANDVPAHHAYSPSLAWPSIPP